MMSERCNFLFIHIPKSGGNSIQNVLRYYSEDEILLSAPHHDGVERFEVRSRRYPFRKHSTLADYQKALPSDVYDRLFKFAVLRNPWERMVSWYFSPGRGVANWDKSEFKKLILRTPTAVSYIKVDNVPSQASASSRENQVHNLERLIDFTDLEKGFFEVCDIVGIPRIKLPIRNKSHRKHYTHYYDSELIKIVNERFQQDVELGNFKFGE